MSRFGFLDRLQTIAATATITSAVWIVVGTVYIERGGQGAAPTAAAPVPASAPARAEVPAAAGGRLTIPVLGVAAAELSDTFGEARGERQHKAIDIMAPAGTTVVAAAPGTVERLFRSDAGGITAYVRSNDRREIYYYAHLQAYASGLAEGQTVRAGQPLGTVGSTGNADPAAPHLHFEVLRTSPGARWYEPATAVNPYPRLVRASP
ncbi:MAG TPA: M23 family metallopeptidase [Croceibacterium sp.]